MLPDPDTCYLALRSRDRRFDGVFFVGVTSTGIYCRPVCPARLPARSRCRFFPHPVAAESEGFRPCLRCRPERAPGRAIVDARSNLAERAAKRIGAGALDRGSVEDLAAELCVGPRQLRRAVKGVYGVSPIQLAQTHRLLLAKRLLAETDLPVTRVAFAAGFSSVRRFNALFRERYRMSPTRLRRRGNGAGSPPGRGTGRPEAAGGTFTLVLDYRPPLAWEPLFRFLEARAIPGVESVASAGGRPLRYLRSVDVEGCPGWIAAGPRDGSGSALQVVVSASLLPALPSVIARLRHLFDLDAEPSDIDGHLALDPALAARVRRRPGLRIPGTMDGFELGWRTVLGQQVSVRGARTLAGRFAESLGAAPPWQDGTAPFPDGLCRLPVRAGVVAETSLGRIRKVGLPRRRAEAVRALARVVADGEVRLEPGADVEDTMGRLQELPGIGPWTALYIALRALQWPDAFPDGDLGLRKALGGVAPAEARRRADQWRPWRGYAALHLWEDPASPPSPSPSESPGPHPSQTRPEAPTP
jgi:AraC family transcriptional regulator, regulatory protein of adaptative response / DNA-3-methyladenine glycosylase II